MKLFLSFLILLFVLLASHDTRAEQRNYTESIAQWASTRHPGEPYIFTVDEVQEFTTEKNDQPKGSLAMLITLKYADRQEHYIILIADQGVYGYKKVEPEELSPGPQENEPSCTPEEHTQHHGKET
jgi:hypothetical protein